jgi:hypothetical protein
LPREGTLNTFEQVHNAFHAEHNPRYLAAAQKHLGPDKVQLTIPEMQRIVWWMGETPSIPGNSVPGLTEENVQRLRYYPVDDTYEMLYGKAPHESWTREETVAKLLVINAAIEDADERCRRR